MLILAIDTSALTATAAVCEYENGGIKKYSLSSVNNGLTHSETLFPLIDNVLKGFGKTVNDVGLFAVAGNLVNNDIFGINCCFRINVHLALAQGHGDCCHILAGSRRMCAVSRTKSIINKYIS